MLPVPCKDSAAIEKKRRSLFVIPKHGHQNWSRFSRFAIRRLCPNTPFRLICESDLGCIPFDSESVIRQYLAIATAGTTMTLNGPKTSHSQLRPGPPARLLSTPYLLSVVCIRMHRQEKLITAERVSRSIRCVSDRTATSRSRKLSQVKQLRIAVAHC